MKIRVLKRCLKTIKPALLTVLITGTLVTFTSSCGKSESDPVINKYDSIINESRTLISDVMAKENILGLAFALICDNKVVWTEGFGYTDTDKKIRVTPETIFSLQSGSKTITTTAEMIAVQDGLINLDKPISAYLPDFTVHSRYDENPQEKITVRQLLSHFAGFAQEAPVGNNIYPESPSFEAHIKSISDTWLRYPVGQRYSYSDLGIDLAGYILQVKSGKPFPDYIKEKLLDPIGMKSSTFDMNIIRKNPNRAIGHSASAAKVPLEIPMIPCGGFYTNAVDLAKFVQFHLNKGEVNGKSILKPELIDEMYTIPYPVNNQYEGYALGIVKVWDNNYHVFYYIHGGGGFGFLSNMVWFPDYGAGFIILTNNDSNTTQTELTNQITNLILSQKPPTDHSPLAVDKMRDIAGNVNIKEMEKYNGTYWGRFDRLDVTVGNPTTFRFNNDSYDAKFVSPGICMIGDTYYCFIPADITPAYIIRSRDGDSWDYNDGPNDQPGPAKQEWEKYTGTYTGLLWGQTPLSITIVIKNGYLYLVDYDGNQFKLLEYRPGLFFTSTGEYLDFRGESPIIKGIKVQKVK